MADDMSVRQWLERYGDWLGFAQILAVMIASVIAFMQRTKGFAVLFSHVASGVCTLVLYVAGVSLGYGLIFTSVASAVLGGALGMALFRLLISVSDQVDRRREGIAGRIVDAAESKIPGGNSP